MSFTKELLAKKELNQTKKMQGYRKILKKTGTYNMECPCCQNALSNYDVTKEQCIHCGYILKWNES